MTLRRVAYDPAILNAIRARQPRPQPAPAPVNPLAGILSNPLVVQAGIDKERANKNANDALRTQRSEALINYGSPELANLPQIRNTVNENTAASAAANQYSTLANLGYQNEQGKRALLNMLAGHGLLHSGDLGHRQGEQARAFGQANYDATQQLLAQLNGYLNQYLGSEQSANQGYTNALLNSFGQYGQNPLGLLG